MRSFLSELCTVLFLGTFLFPRPLVGQTGNGKLRTVVIDPGHGGHDPGAVANGVREKDIVLQVALRLGNKIKSEFPDVKLIYTRSKDTFIPLYERAAIAIRNKADVFISLHANYVAETSVKGTETFTLGLHRSQENLEVAKKENSVILLEEDYSTNYQGFDPNETESYIMFESMQAEYQSQSIELAASIQDEFAQNLKWNHRGVKQAGFLVLRETSMPSVLIEVGFISNPEERKFLVSDGGKEKVAESVFRAFSTYKKGIDRKSRFELAQAGQIATGETSGPGQAGTENKTAENRADGAIAEENQSKQSVQNHESQNRNPVDSVKSSRDTALSISKMNVKNTNRTLPAKPGNENMTTPPPGKSSVEAKKEQPTIEPGQVFYSVQVGAIATPLEPSPQNFKGENGIFRVKVHPWYKFYSGKFKTIEEALKERSRLTGKFPGAFVVIVENDIPRPSNR